MSHYKSQQKGDAQAEVAHDCQRNEKSGSESATESFLMLF